LLSAAPGWAGVVITCAQVPNEPNVVISYECTAGEEVRCFGLDIQFNNAETVVAVECLSDDYYVYLGQFSYDGVTPNFGTCDCTGKPGALPGPNGVTIEMCSLYADDDPDHNEPPAASNGLVKITVSGSTCITITENSLRGGGVLLADNTVLPDPNLPDPSGCCIESGCCCVPPGPECVQWKLQGKPGAWCCPHQAEGDLNGDGYCNPIDVIYILRPAYPSAYGDANYDCRADMNHDGYVNPMDVIYFLRPNYPSQFAEPCPDEWKNHCGS